MQVTFSHLDLQPLVDAAKESETENLKLIVNHGIYFALVRNEQEPLTAYSHECNPSRQEFDTWWAVKSSIFDGDDDIIDIEVDDIQTWLSERAREMKERKKAVRVAIKFDDRGLALTFATLR